MMKTTRHSLMAKGILVLLSLLILIFVFTYSWFVDPDTPVEASGLSMSVRNPSTDFEYSIGFLNSQTGYQYKHTAFTNVVNNDLNLEALLPHDESDSTKTINLLYDYTPTDLTGDGVTLVRPAMKYGNWSINTATSNYSIAEENKQYISFDMIFRTKVKNTTIRLDSGSFAKGACETYSGDGTLLTDTASRNKDNKYGEFSTDAIVGAVRVAFINYVDNHESGSTVTEEQQSSYADTPALIWIPRPDLYLNNNPTNAQTTREKEISGWGLNTNVGSTDTFNLVSDSQTNPSYSTYIHQYYNIFEKNVAHGITTYTGAVASKLDTSVSGANKVTFGTSRDLVTLTHINDTNNDNEPDDQYYYGKVRVRIWIEGTDSEARRALAGGKFSVSFHITG
jgi:hypothetical protein